MPVVLVGFELEVDDLAESYLSNLAFMGCDALVGGPAVLARAEFV